MNQWVVKNLFLPAHERMLGRNTLSYLRGLEESQWWSAERLREFQTEKLRRLLGHAYEMCPFYRRRMDAAGYDPAGATISTLSQLPTLCKADMTKHASELIDVSVPGGVFDYTTGGSTGSPLIFKIDRRRQAADQAARARTRRWFGIDIGERELYLWGSPVELSAQDKLKKLRDRLSNHRLLNAFTMTPRAMSSYLDEIERFRPAHIFGYPSSVARLARHANECGRSFVGGGDRNGRSLKAVFVTGEVFLPSDRAVIEEHVSVPVVDGYGSREAGFIAHQCPAGEYHITMESLIVELLDAGGVPVSDGLPGEVTITHLDAYGMPFIRYRTGDIARRAVSPCSCGRGMDSLERIEGRQTDMLRLASGGYAHALSVIYVLREEAAVAEFKIVQQANCDLEVMVVSREGFDEQCSARIIGKLKRRMGEGVGVGLRQVAEIPPEASGKYRHVVSLAE